MKVKIKGIVDQERFQKNLERVAEYLEASGIKKIQGINFYLTPLHPETGEEAVIINSAIGEEVDTIVIDNPTKKTTTKKSSKIKAVKDDQSQRSQKRSRKKTK